MKRLTIIFALLAAPASAAEGAFFSLANTNFIVLLAFLLFVAIIVYFKVPGRIAALLDARAADIRRDLDEARRLREEAQTVLANYERKSREAQGQADAIVEHARKEAVIAAESAKAEIEATIQRRLHAAEEKIASAEAAALRDIRNRAADIAVAAAAEVLRGQLTDEQRSQMIDSSIETVGAKLH